MAPARALKHRYISIALAQLHNILIYTSAHNPDAARRVLARIHRAIHRLTLFPHSARITARAGVRALAVPGFPYVVYYTVDIAVREVRILRVLHAAQDPSFRSIGV